MSVEYLEGRGIDVTNVAIDLGINAEVSAGLGLKGSHLLDHLPSARSPLDASDKESCHQTVIGK